MSDPAGAGKDGTLADELQSWYDWWCGLSSEQRRKARESGITGPTRGISQIIIDIRKLEGQQGADHP